MKLFTKYFKTVVAFGAMVFFVSCSTDVIDNTSGVINNSSFDRETLVVTPALSTINVEKKRSSGLSQYLLGSYTNSNFGTVKSEVVSQMIPDEYPDSIGYETVIDSVTLTLPVSLSLSDEDGVYVYDNFLGDFDSELTLEVSTFENFLEQSNLDTATRVYYSDGTNDGNTLSDIGTETILGSVNKTFLDTYDTDSDSLRVHLDTDFFKTNVLDKISEFYETRTDESDTPSEAEFVQYFKGVKLNVSNTRTGFLAPFSILNANLGVYYQNSFAVEDSDDEVVTDSLKLSFDRVTYGLYDHDHSPEVSSEDELLVQGTGGYEIVVDLAELVESYASQAVEEEWLVNQAKLKVYLKEVLDDTADELYIYGVDVDGNEIALDDYGLFGFSNPVGGQIKDSDGELVNDDLSIEFFITEYVKTVLGLSDVENDDDTITVEDIVELRIKVREFSESATVFSASLDGKGAVLLNTTEKAPELEIIYTPL